MGSSSINLLAGIGIETSIYPLGGYSLTFNNNKLSFSNIAITENENKNLRIKALLTELLNPEHKIEIVRPYSQSQQEILKI
jgi:hypothetical protein